MRIRYRGFTLIELLIVVAVISFLAALLLPALSAAKKKALRSSLSAAAPSAQARPTAVGSPGAITRRYAMVRSFGATVLLKPGLSIGTTDPESIYTAKLSAKFEVSNPAGNGECEVLLPLPPQIISLADLAVTINGKANDSLEIRGDKLAWVGVLPVEPVPMTIDYSAVGKGLYHVQPPPSGILDAFHIDLTAVGSDVRMLELSLQPTKYVRAKGQTVYTWDYKNLLYGRPIALDVLGIAPIDRLGELTWLGPASVIVFGLILGLIARAYRILDIDRWMLLLIVGTFMGAYPLMYFAQEFIPLALAIVLSSVLVLSVIGIRVVTIAGFRLGFLGTVVPAALILGITLLASLHTRLQGILITMVGLCLFILAMLLIPRMKWDRPGSGGGFARAGSLA